MSVPLGRTDAAAVERIVMVLDGLSVEQARYFGVDLAGVRLTATDADWTFGDGDAVTGRAADLLLLACGRSVPAGALTGAGAARFVG